MSTSILRETWKKIKRTDQTKQKNKKKNGVYIDKTDGETNRRTLNSYLQGGRFSLKHKRQT